MLALEERTRRDLLVGDDALVAFFDARVPEDVTGARSFARWWRRVVDEQPDLLTYGLGVRLLRVREKIEIVDGHDLSRVL